MKKNKKIEEQLSQDLEKYYEDIEVPELSLEKQEELRNLVKQNTPKRKRFALWQTITAVASAVCLVALIIIPTIVMLNKNDDPQNPPPITPPIYFGKDEATKVELNLVETQNIVNTQFAKYNFMFTDLTYISSKGFYNPENNNLLAIQIIFNEKEIPYTQVEIHLVSSKQFILDEQTIYTTDAEQTITATYEMYKLYQLDLIENMFGYIIFEDHEIYIHLARINETLFNKFI